MQATTQPRLSRRGFLKGVGAGAGALGLANLAGGLAGCKLEDRSLLHGAEMVGGVTGTRADVCLVAGSECEPGARFRISYGTTPRALSSEYELRASPLSGFREHDTVNFPLESLLPDTRYYYRVSYDLGDGWVDREERSFRTRRAPGSGFRFCIATDTHVYPINHRLETSRRVYRNISRDNPDFLVTLGDDAFLGYQSHKVYPWPEQEKILNGVLKMRGLLDEACHSMFYLPVNGNHEGLYGWTMDREEYATILDARIRYFPVPGQRTFPEGGDPLGRYGAFRWGDALFVWLDPVGFCPEDPHLVKDASRYVLGAPQRAFLERTLADHASVPWKFILSHEVFGGLDGECSQHYGRGNANAAQIHEQAEIQKLMVRYNVQAFFYGHDHVFSASRAEGRSYICSGHAGSGCPWPEVLEACYEPWVVFTRDADGRVPAGHVRVDVAAEEVSVSYVIASPYSKEDGRVADSYVMRL